MIAQLTGRVAEVSVDSAIIDVGGVGYLVQCSRPTLERLQGGEGAISLLVDLQVREDSLTLYGFFDRAERDWFRLLMAVQGVGGRVALAILSALPPDALSTAILAEDRRSLTRADGVGPKLAGRLIGELRDKVGGMAIAPAAIQPVAAMAAPTAGAPNQAADAVSALVNLGYGRSEAYQAVSGAAQALGDAAPLEALLTKALSRLAPEPERLR